jgi:hypothetical protein
MSYTYLIPIEDRIHTYGLGYVYLFYLVVDSTSRMAQRRRWRRTRRRVDYDMME